MQATKTGERLGELIQGKAIYPIRSVRYSTMARATETYQLILPHLPAMLPHQCQPCSMIREGAVCRPDPPSLYWTASDEDFTKDGMRVSRFRAVLDVVRIIIGAALHYTSHY